MRLRRWELVAASEAGSHFSKLLAEQFNRQPQRFLFRRSAVDAVRFYESRIYLPVHFYVRRVE